MKLNWPAGLDESRFLAEYWQQKPLLLRNAFENFDNPISPDELAGLACEEDCNARYIEHTGNNEWRLCAGPLSDDFFDDVSGHEWSLLVSDVEKLIPEFRNYLQPFRFLPDWRIDDLMISYAPVGGSVGAHVDQYDVFLLQADGVREWQIENTARAKNSASVSSTIAILGDFIADETWQLQAGDMLYLPPQFAHHGVAKSDPCMTWSIGFRAPSVDEMMPEIMNYLMEDQSITARFTDPDRKPTVKPGLIDDKDINSLRKMLTTALQQSDATLNQWIGRCVTEPKEVQNEPQLRSDLTEQVIEKYLSNGSSLHSNSQKRLAYSIANSQTTLFADGNPYTCPESLAAAICNRYKVDSEDVTASQSIDLVTTLCQLQILLMEDDPN